MAGTAPRTQYFVASSLDGFIADEHDSLDWLVQFEQGEGPTPYDRFIPEVGALAMGARTYEWIQREYPGQWFYGDRPTWVFTHRALAGVDGANLTFTQGDVARVHTDMLDAAGDKNVWLVGGGDLVSQFADLDLVDELRVSIAPVTLGRGSPLLPRRGSPMRLVSAETARGGAFVHLVYAMGPRG